MNYKILRFILTLPVRLLAIIIALPLMLIFNETYEAFKDDVRTFIKWVLR